MSGFLNSTHISDSVINEFSKGKVSLLGHPAVRIIYSGRSEQPPLELKTLMERTIIDNTDYLIMFTTRADRFDSLI
jgi:hypothetical protein